MDLFVRICTYPRPACHSDAAHPDDAGFNQTLWSDRLTEKSYRILTATNLAEAGIELAIWELNFGSIWIWEGDPNNRNFKLRTKRMQSYPVGNIHRLDSDQIPR